MGITHSKASSSVPPLVGGGDWDADHATPLTTKGDLLGYASDIGRIPVGDNGEVLTADSAEALGVKWAAPAVVPVPTLLQSMKASADTPDDDFNGTSLDAKWTVVDGASGTVNLLIQTGTGVYQVGARPGWLSMAPGLSSGDSVILRQDYTLPDGKCIVAYMSFPLDWSAAPTNNEVWAGIGVNDNDTGPWAATSGQTANLILDTDTTGFRVIGLSATTPTYIGGNTSAGTGPASGVFFRIDRSGLNYYLFYSVDGFAWTLIGGKTMASEATNVWLFAECRATMTTRISTDVPWFRQGTALALDPWTL